MSVRPDSSTTARFLRMRSNNPTCPTVVNGYRGISGEQFHGSRASSSATDEARDRREYSRIYLSGNLERWNRLNQ